LKKSKEILAALSLSLSPRALPFIVLMREVQEEHI
jgi:hypothetical protein